MYIPEWVRLIWALKLLSLLGLLGFEGFFDHAEAAYKIEYGHSSHLQQPNVPDQSSS